MLNTDEEKTENYINNNRAHDLSDTRFQQLQSDVPHLTNQSELKNLVRDLSLSKSQAELPGLKLQQCVR